MNYIVLVILIIVFSISIFKKIDIVDEFTIGAKEGIKSAVSIIPILVCVITIISVFRASGAVEVLEKILLPFANVTKIPKEALPLVVLRPISGSASLAMLTDIVSKYGADTFIGRVACTMSSSTETTLYAVSVYSQGSGLKKTNKVLIAGILADVFSAICAVFSVIMFFPST